MKVSELTEEVICQHCKLIAEDLTPAEKSLLKARERAAVQYCMKYTGLTEAELDSHEDITIAVLVLISDMIDNANMYIGARLTTNQTVETILGMHSKNLIPSEAAP